MSELPENQVPKKKEKKRIVFKENTERLVYKDVLAEKIKQK